MTVKELWVYPLKSGRGVQRQRVELGCRGFVGDRRWMLIDKRARFISARTHPELLLVEAQADNRTLTLRAPGVTALVVDIPGSPAVDLEIWGDQTTGRDAGDSAADWFSKWLGLECRLVYQSDTDQRLVAPQPSTTDDDEVSFADAYPVHVVGSASVEDLNHRISSGDPVTTKRFRPNLVIETRRPYEEDDWVDIQVGPCRLINVKPCPRCTMTTIDPQTAKRHPSGEPLRTLGSYRRRDGSVWFGINLVPRVFGEICLGDELQVVSSR